MVGIGFFFGGLQRPEQNFDRTSTNDSLDTLVLCVATLIIPTALNFFSGLDKSSAEVAKVSRAEAVLLLLSYFFYLYFAYKTHAYMYTTPHLRVPMRNFLPGMEGDTMKNFALIGGTLAATAGGRVSAENPMREPEPIDLPKMSWWTLSLTLVIDTIFLGFCATFAVDSIDGLTQRTVLTQNFVGLILLPLLGCNIHAIKLAMKDEMPRSFSITIGSSIQILSCILPVAVIIGWIRDDPTMNLIFDGFQVVSFAISLMILKYIVNDGKSNWYVSSILGGRIAFDGETELDPGWKDLF